LKTCSHLRTNSAATCEEKISNNYTVLPFFRIIFIPILVYENEVFNFMSDLPAIYNLFPSEHRQPHESSFNHVVACVCKQWNVDHECNKNPCGRSFLHYFLTFSIGTGLLGVKAGAPGPVFFSTFRNAGMYASASTTPITTSQGLNLSNNGILFSS